MSPRTPVATASRERPLPGGAGSSAPADDELPRCPYAHLGTDLMLACSGFVAETLGVVAVRPWGVDVGPVSGVSCAHLGFQESPNGGFISACLFPGGPPPRRPDPPAGP